ncbi:MAG: hypothetical protein AVDCRST_MAG61-2736, partial [uncultured Friedmanniella sp.]
DPASRLRRAARIGHRRAHPRGSRPRSDARLAGGRGTALVRPHHRRRSRPQRRPDRLAGAHGLRRRCRRTRCRPGVTPHGGTAVRVDLGAGADRSLRRSGRNAGHRPIDRGLHGAAGRHRAARAARIDPAGRGWLGRPRHLPEPRM